MLLPGEPSLIKPCANLKSSSYYSGYVIADKRGINEDTLPQSNHSYRGRYSYDGAASRPAGIRDVAPPAHRTKAGAPKKDPGFKNTQSSPSLEPSRLKE